MLMFGKKKAPETAPPPPATPASSTTTANTQQTVDMTQCVGDSNLPNLVRIHLLSANLHKEYQTYAVVSVGKNAARTKTLVKTSAPSFDEHFIIEYALADEPNLEVKVAIYDKGKMMDDEVAVWKMPLSEVTKPLPEEEEAAAKKSKKDKEKEKESWYTEKPNSFPLLDKSGKKEVGTLAIRARREDKVVGTLKLQVKEATLPNDNDTSLVAKLALDAKTAEPVKGKKGKFSWKKAEFLFEATMQNNVRDLFIECRQADQLIGEVRVTLFDAQNKALKKPQPILDHNTKQQIGEMKLKAEILKKK